MNKWTMTYEQIHDKMWMAIKVTFKDEHIPTIDIITAMESIKWHLGLQFLAQGGKKVNIGKGFK